MISHRTLASVMLVAFGATSVRFADASTLPPNDATVVALSVAPTTGAAGRADVVIRVDGTVTLKHTYQLPGNYDIKATVVNDAGQSTTATIGSMARGLFVNDKNK